MEISDEDESKAQQQPPPTTIWSWFSGKIKLAFSSPSSLVFWLSAGAVCWAFAKLLLSRRRHRIIMEEAFREYREDVQKLRLEVRSKQDQLQQSLARLRDEVDVSRQAIQQNAMLRQKLQFLQKDLAEQKEQQRQSQFQCEKTEQQNQQLVLKVHSQEQQLKQQEEHIVQISTEKQQVQQEKQQMHQLLDTKDKQLVAIGEEKNHLTSLLVRAREVQEIMEYVLGRFAPDLAKRLQDILAQHAARQEASKTVELAAGSTPMEQQSILAAH